MYTYHYYLSKGKNPPKGVFVEGIRHGHLVEFGSAHNSPMPYLWPAVQSKKRAMEKMFAEYLWKTTLRRVKSIVSRATRKANLK